MFYTWLQSGKVSYLVHFFAILTEAKTLLAQNFTVTTEQMG